MYGLRNRSVDGVVSKKLAGNLGQARAVRIRRAISTDILEFRRRVLVVQGAGRGCGRAALISDAVLPVYSGDRAIGLSRAVASSPTGSRVPVVGCP